MLRLKWGVRMLRDVARFGWVNSSPAMSVTILVLLLVGVVIGAAQVSAPFIYTLF